MKPVMHKKEMWDWTIVYKCKKYFSSKASLMKFTSNVFYSNIKDKYFFTYEKNWLGLNGLIQIQSEKWMVQIIV